MEEKDSMNSLIQSDQKNQHQLSVVSTPDAPIIFHGQNGQHGTPERSNDELDLEKGDCSKEIRTTLLNQNKSPGDTSRPGSSITEVGDPNLVGWDGDHDPANPQNWPRSRKWGAIVIGMETQFNERIL
jgi:hypothetical protein